MVSEPGIYLLLGLLIIFILCGRIEWVRHIYNVKLIPMRIIVNGTRGKSSVARLIAAGLKAGGYRVLAKTTGTKPSMVLNNLFEIPIIRFGKANIREQLSIFKKGVSEGVKAIVFENMSIRPDLQWIEEAKIVQPTVVVITNVRADHLDVMGPTVSDVAKTFINAIPRKAEVFTAEDALFPLMEGLCKRRNIRLIQSKEDNIKEREMAGFPYFEHRENVALAIKVCEHLGIERELALNEMHKCIPDSGVLRGYQLLIDKKRVLLYNALAANDPDSTYLIYERMEKSTSHLYILINCRSDRIDRSLQLAELIEKKMVAELYFLTGGNTTILRKKALTLGIAKERLVDLGNKGIAKVYEELAKRVEDDSTIFAIGNIVGYGEQLVEYFKKKGTL